MRNEVVISGLINGDIKELANDGIMYTLSDQDKDGASKDFIITSYSDTAKLIKSRGKSGMRVVGVGRLSREKLDKDSEVYHDIVQIYKVLSIGGEDGSGYAKAFIEGLGEAKEIKTTSNSGTKVLNVNLKHIRSYKDKAGDVQERTSYHNGVLWNAQAEQQSPHLPIQDKPLALYGNLKPSTYPSKKYEGEQVHKLEVFADGMYSADFSEAQSAPTTTRAPRTASTASTRTKGSGDNHIPF